MEFLDFEVPVKEVLDQMKQVENKAWSLDAENPKFESNNKKQ